MPSAHPTSWLRSVLLLLALGMALLVACPVQAATPVTAMAAGGNHTCALLSGGAVQCWGSNDYGQLGNGTTTDSPIPVGVVGISDATALAAGELHTCALVSGGAVQCWGANFSGQMGNGTTANSRTPVTVVGISDATVLAAGGAHTCAIVSGGAVQCWGDNSYGQLGYPNTTFLTAISPTPVTVVGISGATALAVGEFHTCAISNGGEVRCWGNNSYGQLGNGTAKNSPTPVAVVGISGATALAAGASHTCAIISSRTVQCWGSNSYGQLGNGKTTAFNDPTPTPVTVVGIDGATALAVGRLHTCAISNGGEVRCWGNNFYGQLGNGTTTISLTPTGVVGISGATALTANDHTCAINGGGAVQCWGSNSEGQMGNGTATNSPTPVGVVGISGATALAAGHDHTCAIVSGGALWCWGGNFNGQLGTLGNGMFSSTPVAVSGISDATALAAGGAHTCALVNGGEVRCWGANFYGQLGNGSIRKFYTPDPTQVAVIGISDATALAAGGSHTCAIVSGGAVWCWGGNFEGQLGNGTTKDTPTPVAVVGISGATALVAGDAHTCAVVSSKTVQCWGSNSYGQLGNGRTSAFNAPTPTPVTVVGISGATALAAGSGSNIHTCAIVSGGAVRCWGRNSTGQLGDGTVTDSSTPVAAVGISGATALAAGYGHTCAKVSDGSIRCWGRNFDGQLGNSTATAFDTPMLTPVTAVGIRGATALVAGSGHTCALLDSGRLRCWGRNGFGQLGTDSTTFKTLPGSVPFSTPINAAITPLPALQGGTQTLASLTAFLNDGSSLPVHATVWDSSNPDVVSIDNSGVLTARAVLADTPVEISAFYAYPGAVLPESKTRTVITPVSPSCSSNCMALVAQSGSSPGGTTGNKLTLQPQQMFKLALNLRRFAAEPVDIYVRLNLPGIPDPFWVGTRGVVFGENTFSASAVPFASARPNAWPDADVSVLAFPQFPDGLPKGDYTFRAYAVTQGVDPFDTNAQRGEAATAVLTIR